MRGQAVASRTRIPVSVVLGCLAAGMSTEGILTEHPTLTVDAERAATTDGALLAREELFPLRPRVKVKLDDNVPVTAAEMFTTAGLAVEPGTSESLAGATDGLAGRGPPRPGGCMITLDRPPGDHRGILVLRQPVGCRPHSKGRLDGLVCQRLATVELRSGHTSPLWAVRWSLERPHLRLRLLSWHRRVLPWGRRRQWTALRPGTASRRSRDVLSARQWFRR